MSAQLVATLCPAAPAEAAAVLRAPPPGVDYLELRLDALSAPTPAAVAELLALPRTVPVVATCRAAAQGGAFIGDETARLTLLAAAAEAGADLIDVEDTSLADLPGALDGDRLVASCHLARFVPRLPALARRVAGHGTAFAKLAVPADTPRHLAELLELQEELGEDLAIVPTGRLAEAGRVMIAGRGAPLVYGAVDPGRPGHADQPAASRLHDVYTLGLVNAGTRFFAVVGHPVGHSLSPAFHNAVFRGVAANARLVALDIEHLADVLAFADALRLDGLAVTHPLKQEAVARAGSVLPGARTTGAANTLLRTPAGWQARNTDWKAACDLLPRLLRGWQGRSRARGDWLAKAVTSAWRGTAGPAGPKHGEPPTPRVLLLGSGGAARAVAVALFEQEIELAVWSRRLCHGRSLVDDLGGTVPAHAIPDPSHFPADLVINATPVGLPGTDGGELERVAPSQFREGAVLVDLTYGGTDSPLRRAAAEAGAGLVPGEVFFGLQARRQAEAFLGASVPPELLKEAALRCELGL